MLMTSAVLVRCKQVFHATERVNERNLPKGFVQSPADLFALHQMYITMFGNREVVLLCTG